MPEEHGKRGASQWAVAWRRFRRNKSALIGSAIVVFFIAVALLAPYIAPYPARSYLSLYEGDAGTPPSFKHPFGVEDSGIDVFSETIHGTKNDLYVGLAATLITTLIGVAVGAVAGYFKGVVSDVLLGLTQVFFVIPVLLLILLFARVFSVLGFQGVGPYADRSHTLVLWMVVISFHCKRRDTQDEGDGVHSSRPISRRQLIQAIVQAYRSQYSFTSHRDRHLEHRGIHLDGGGCELSWALVTRTHQPGVCC